MDNLLNYGILAGRMTHDEETWNLSDIFGFFYNLTSLIYDPPVALNVNIESIGLLCGLLRVDGLFCLIYLCELSGSYS